MVKKYLLLLLFCFPIKAGMFVTVDWANVREHPGKNARRVAQLPFGTWFSVAEQKDGWVRIGNIGHQRIIGTVNGWVSLSVLSRCKYEMFLRELGKYPKMNTLGSLRRCAVSIDSCRSALYEYYKSRDDREGLDRWRELYDSTSFRPVYVAIRDCDQMRVMGYIDSAGAFTPLEISTDGPFDSSEVKPITKHISVIRQKRWYVLQSGAHEYMPRFIAPASGWQPHDDLDKCSYGLMPPTGISLGSFRETYQQDKYTILSSEPMTSYYAEVDSYMNQGRKNDIQIALKTMWKYFKEFIGGDTDLPAKARIRSFTVNALPFGYREITLRGDLAPGKEIALDAFKIILDKDDKVVWPQPADNYLYQEGLGLNEVITEHWFSFRNLENSFFRIIRITGPGAYYVAGESGGGAWEYQILRLSPEGLSVLGERTDGA